MPPWVVSQGGYACDRAVRARGASVCARAQRALGVRAVVHVVTQFLFARGVRVLRRSTGHCRTPTARVDTAPPQEGSTCTYAPLASLPHFGAEESEDSSEEGVAKKDVR